MTSNAIKAAGELLATKSISVARNIPEWLLAKERVPAWFNLSLALVNLAFAKHWLPFLPDFQVATALDKAMDDCFFGFIEYTNFEICISDVIVDATEIALCCRVIGIKPEDFSNVSTDTLTLISAIFASRCNEYAGDLRAGIIYNLEKQPRVLGPVIFAYKRLNQHIWGVRCDVRSTVLDENFRYLCPLDSMLLEGHDATQQLFFQVKKSLGL